MAELIEMSFRMQSCVDPMNHIFVGRGTWGGHAGPLQSMCSVDDWYLYSVEQY